MNKLILHIPHAATKIPMDEGYCVSKERIQHEIELLTDWYTDDLFENKFDTSIKAPFSRVFCDTERFSDDSQEVMAQFGMGVLYEKTDSGEPLRKLTPKLRGHILENYYWKHHNHFNATVQQALQESNKATIIDCHSFPDKPLPRALDKSFFRPDFNIGTDVFHTPQKWIEELKTFFQEKGYLLGIDRPYEGTIVPMNYYKKDKNVQSIMLEINRRLYLQEPSMEKSAHYQKTKQVVQEFLNLIRKIQ